MLYQRWLEIAHQHASEPAVIDAAAGQRLSFADLAGEVDRIPKCNDPILFPQGHSLDFIRTVLRGWRDDKIVCPLEAGQKPPAIPSPPKGCAHLKLTSATTGPARMIVFRAEQLFADAQNIVPTMGLKKDWPNVAFISLAHSYGFSNLITPLALFGIPLVLANPPLPEVLKRVASELREFTLPAVPALWQTWHDAGAIPKNVRLAISAGAPLSLNLEADIFKRHGLKIHNFYGSSECGGIAYDRSVTPRAEAALAGTALDSVLLRQTDGLLEVSGPAVGETYWPEADERLEKGSFLTCDLDELRAGEVYLRGRATDLINVAGRKVSPEVIERELLRHPAVRDCVVFGTPDAGSGRGECIAACVVGGTSEKELRDFLSPRVAPWQVPRIWHFMDALPRNERGKISRGELRKKLQ